MRARASAGGRRVCAGIPGFSRRAQYRPRRYTDIRRLSKTPTDEQKELPVALCVSRIVPRWAIGELRFYRRLFWIDRQADLLAALHRRRVEHYDALRTDFPRQLQ